MKDESQIKKSEWTPNRIFRALFLGLLSLDFIFYKIFGETRNGPPSSGWYLFLIISILCALAGLSWLATSIREWISSCRKEHKKNKRDGNSV